MSDISGPGAPAPRVNSGAGSHDLPALLGSRICHDLISPLGAIANGLELLEMAGGGGEMGPELALINESVANANARIRFFRVAFGAAGAESRLGRAEITGLLADVTRGGRLRVEWRVPGDVGRAEAKLAFLMLQCLETALPYGGRVTLDRSPAGWEARAEAEKIRAVPGLWAWLGVGPGPDVAKGATEEATGGATGAVTGTAAGDVTPAHAHFLLAAHEARRRGHQVSVREAAHEIQLAW